MSAFDLLKEHYEKNMGNLGAGRALFREENAKRKVEADDGDMAYIEQSEDISEAAEKTRKDHARAFEDLEGAIKRSKDDREIQKMAYLFLDKARKPTGKAPGRPPKQGDPYLKRPESNPYQQLAGKWWKRVGHEGAIRQIMRGEYRPGTSKASPGTALYRKYARCFEEGRSGKSTEKSLEKGMDPKLSSLLSAAASWALSGDIVDREVPKAMQREWERAISREEKRRLEEEMMRRMKRSVRKSEDSDLFNELQMFYKDHAPVPPRLGLMWDAVKHRWTRPEKVGRTVWEVQGKKRLRGSGTGVHERSIARRGAGGKGTGSMEAGRRFRGIADSGRAHPHESKYPGHVTVRRAKKTQTKRKAR